jgi:hypothetical protein
MKLPDSRTVLVGAAATVIEVAPIETAVPRPLTVQVPPALGVHEAEPKPFVPIVVCRVALEAALLGSSDFSGV